MHAVCLCTSLVSLCPTCILVHDEHTICTIYENADGTPQNPPFFPSSSGTWQLQENNPALGLCCVAAHCAQRCSVVCVLYVHLCTHICVCRYKKHGLLVCWHLCKTMAAPGPPPLVSLSLLLLLSKASPPAAAYTLTPGRQPQHKLLHLGEGAHTESCLQTPTLGYKRSCWNTLLLTVVMVSLWSQIGPRIVARLTSSPTWRRGLCLGMRPDLIPGRGRCLYR